MKTLIEDLIQTEATIMQIVSVIKTIKPECGNQLAGGTCIQRAIAALREQDKKIADHEDAHWSDVNDLQARIEELTIKLQESERMYLEDQQRWTAEHAELQARIEELEETNTGLFLRWYISQKSEGRGNENTSKIIAEQDAEIKTNGTALNNALLTLQKAQSRIAELESEIEGMHEDAAGESI